MYGPVGNFTMTAWGISDDGYNISIAYDFTVTPGRAVSLDHVTTHEHHGWERSRFTSNRDGRRWEPLPTGCHVGQCLRYHL